MKVVICCLFCLLFLFSCAENNLAYLSDLEDNAKFDTSLSIKYEPRIQVGDILGITMNSLNMESNNLFNNGSLQLTSNLSSGIPIGSSMLEGYHVDKNGIVGLPIVGRITVAGLTREEATDKITENLKKYTKDPTVNIRILNFKVTVIGEVSRPSTIAVPTEKVNILEALGYAGDLTPFGKRDNVLIIRDVDGMRSTARVNLNSKKLLDSPYFYLQQNDIVYVEPNKAKALQASTRTYNLPIIISLASLTAFIVSALR